MNDFSGWSKKFARTFTKQKEKMANDQTTTHSNVRYYWFSFSGSVKRHAYLVDYPKASTHMQSNHVRERLRSKPDHGHKFEHMVQNIRDLLPRRKTPDL
jgi:hypothetical protein